MEWLKSKKSITIGLLLTLVCGIALAAGFEQIPQPLLKLGRGLAENIQILFNNQAGETLTVSNTGDAALTSDQLTLGDGTNTNKRQIWDIGAGANNPYMGYDSASGNVGFSKDGVKFSQFGTGSGSGSGINLLNPDNNPGFEDGTDTWVPSTPAHLTLETVDPIFGDQSGIWDPSAASDTLETADIVVIRELETNNCGAEFKYAWDAGTLGEITAHVQTDGGDDLTDPLDLTPTTGSVGTWTVNFRCPDNDSIKITLTATANAQPITLDSFHLGSSLNTGLVDFWRGWREYTEADVTIQETGPTALDNVQAFLLPYQNEAKEWRLRFNITAKFQAAATTKFLDIVGVTFEPGAGTPAFAPATLWKQTLSCTTQAQLSSEGCDAWVDQNTSTISLQGENSEFTYNVSGDVRLSGKPTWAEDKQLPQEVVSLKTQGWRLRGDIGGSLIGLATTDTTTFSVINGNVDMILAPGSRDAKITCSGAPAEGLTCTGNEQVGVNFIAPRAGDYRTCFSLSTEYRIEELDFLTNTFKIVVKSNSDDSVLQDNGIAQLHGGSFNSTAALDWDNQVKFHHVCETYTLPAGENSISLRYLTEVSGSAALLNRIFSSRSATYGVPTIGFEVLPVVTGIEQLVAIAEVETERTADCFNGNICSGFYTPTAPAPDATNIDSATPFKSIYMRVGNVVTVGITLTLDVTASNVATRQDLSLPIPSDIIAAQDVTGTCVMLDTASPDFVAAFIEGDTTDDEISIRFRANMATSTKSYRCTILYEIN